MSFILTTTGTVSYVQGGGKKFYQQKTIQPRCIKMAIDQLLLAAGSSDLVGRMQKCYFIIICGCFLSVRLYSRPNAGPTTKKRVPCKFSKKWLNRKVDSDKNLTLLIDRHVCLVFSSFKITLFPT